MVTDSMHRKFGEMWTCDFGVSHSFLRTQANVLANFFLLQSC